MKFEARLIICLVEIVLASQGKPVYFDREPTSKNFIKFFVVIIHEYISVLEKNPYVKCDPGIHMLNVIRESIF